jgi:hypothetical protein
MLSRSLAFGLICAAAFGFAGTASHAQDAKSKTKPALSSHTRALKIDVEIDPKLRADARLYQTLLDDGKKLIAEQRKEADSSWREDRTMFRNGPWEYERNYSLDAEAGPYISVSVLDYSYSGGAHPNTYIKSMLWNREQGKPGSIAALFRETKTDGPTLTALAALIRDGVAQEKKERGADVDADPAKDSYLVEIKPDLKTMGAPALVASKVSGKAAGIEFNFSPYDVGAYAEGSYAAFVPWQKLEPFLTDAARAWFGGERVEPKRDDR